MPPEVAAQPPTIKRPKAPVYPRPVSPLHYEPVFSCPKDTIAGDGYDPPSEPDEEQRLAKKRRIEKLGEHYLRGGQLFILSVGIKGPLGKGWKNPWAKKRGDRKEKKGSREARLQAEDGEATVTAQQSRRSGRFVKERRELDRRQDEQDADRHSPNVEMDADRVAIAVPNFPPPTDTIPPRRKGKLIRKKPEASHDVQEAEGHSPKTRSDAIANIATPNSSPLMIPTVSPLPFDPFASTQEEEGKPRLSRRSTDDWLRRDHPVARSFPLSSSQDHFFLDHDPFDKAASCSFPAAVKDRDAVTATRLVEENLDIMSPPRSIKRAKVGSKAADQSDLQGNLSSSHDPITTGRHAQTELPSLDHHLDVESEADEMMLDALDDEILPAGIREEAPVFIDDVRSLSNSGGDNLAGMEPTGSTPDMAESHEGPFTKRLAMARPDIAETGSLEAPEATTAPQSSLDRMPPPASRSEETTETITSAVPSAQEAPSLQPPPPSFSYPSTGDQLSDRGQQATLPKESDASLSTEGAAVNLQLQQEIARYVEPALDSSPLPQRAATPPRPRSKEGITPFSMFASPEANRSSQISQSRGVSFPVNTSAAEGPPLKPVVLIPLKPPGASSPKDKSKRPKSTKPKKRASFARSPSPAEASNSSHGSIKASLKVSKQPSTLLQRNSLAKPSKARRNAQFDQLVNQAKRSPMDGAGNIRPVKNTTTNEMSSSNGVSKHRRKTMDHQKPDSTLESTTSAHNLQSSDRTQSKSSTTTTTTTTTTRSNPRASIITGSAESSSSHQDAQRTSHPLQYRRPFDRKSEPLPQPTNNNKPLTTATTTLSQHHHHHHHHVVVSNHRPDAAGNDGQPAPLANHKPPAADWLGNLRAGSESFDVGAVMEDLVGFSTEWDVESELRKIGTLPSQDGAGREAGSSG